MNKDKKEDNRKFRDNKKEENKFNREDKNFKNNENNLLLETQTMKKSIYANFQLITAKV